MSETPAADREPTDLRFVGPATADVVDAADFDAADVAAGRVSYAMLLEAGANPGVAARIRREHSLPWAFEHTEGDDLRRRSEQVRQLGEAERAWVTASADGWTAVEATDGGRTAEAAERAWRDGDDS